MYKIFVAFFNESAHCLNYYFHILKQLCKYNHKSKIMIIELADKIKDKRYVHRLEFYCIDYRHSYTNHLSSQLQYSARASKYRYGLPFLSVHISFLL